MRICFCKHQKEYEFFWWYKTFDDTIWNLNSVGNLVLHHGAHAILKSGFKLVDCHEFLVLGSWNIVLFFLVGQAPFSANDCDHELQCWDRFPCIAGVNRRPLKPGHGGSNTGVSSSGSTSVAARSANRRNFSSWHLTAWLVRHVKKSIWTCFSALTRSHPTWNARP